MFDKELTRRGAFQLAGAMAIGGLAITDLALNPSVASAAPGINPASAGGLGPVHVISRSANQMDAFAVGVDGFVYTAAWQPGDAAFRGWWKIGDLQVAPCSPVTAVSRSANLMDIFVAGLDGRVHTASWQPGDTAFQGWWPVGDLITTPGATISVISRSANLMDVFAAGIDGSVYTAAWKPGDASFRGWWQVGNLKVAPGAPVTAVSRSANLMDVFAVGMDGKIYTAAWQPGDAAFRGWWPVAGGTAQPGAAVTAISRATNKMDLFVVASDSKVYTASWEPGDTAFRGWWAVGNVQVPPRSAVTVISRSANRMDVFATGTDGKIYTAAWQPGDAAFRGWWPVAGGMSLPGTQVTALSRSTDRMDVFAPGMDGKVYTAAWQPGDTAFRGWWPVSSLITGIGDPGVSQWTNVGTAYYAENTGYSEEAQGITTDGTFWYLVSNGSKTLRKMNGSSLIAEVGIPVGAHVGAPGYYDGWIYVPVQGPHGVWRIRSDFTQPQWLPVTTSDNRFSWCGVNPLNGRLYTSMYDIYNGQIPTLFAYERNTMQRRPEDDVVLQASPMHLDRIQGGTFTNRGRVILVRSDPNGVFCYSARTGYCFGARSLGDFGSSASEVESVVVRPWSFGATPAQVHILELDNDWDSGDDCYLHSFSVPVPHQL